MTRDEILDKVRSILAPKIDVEPESIEQGDTLEDLGFDSLSAIEIIMEVEEEFDCEVDPERATDVNTVESMVDLIEDMLSED